MPGVVRGSKKHSRGQRPSWDRASPTLVRPETVEVAKVGDGQRSKSVAVVLAWAEDCSHTWILMNFGSTRVCLDPAITARSGIVVVASAWKVMFDVPDIKMADVWG